MVYSECTNKKILYTVTVHVKLKINMPEYNFFYLRLREDIY